MITVSSCSGLCRFLCDNLNSATWHAGRYHQPLPIPHIGTRPPSYEFVSQSLFLSSFRHSWVLQLAECVAGRNTTTAMKTIARRKPAPHLALFHHQRSLAVGSGVGKVFARESKYPHPTFRQRGSLLSSCNRVHQSGFRPSCTDAPPSNSRTSDLVFVYSKIPRTGVQGTHRMFHCRGRGIGLCRSQVRRYVVAYFVAFTGPTDPFHISGI